jgi:diadenosine tetraphosphate (Ap4A) HIT family hydrolase
MATGIGRYHPGTMDDPCPLCAGDGGETVWRSAALRIVLPHEPAWPAFTRVVLARYVAEMTDLDEGEQTLLMDAVWRVERVMRRVLSPDKVNVASLGNLVPHLHWHVVPRWRGDANFPAPPWAPIDAGGTARSALRAATVAPMLPAYREALRAAFAEGGAPAPSGPLPR